MPAGVPVTGTWGEWSAWGQCSVSCGGGGTRHVLIFEANKALKYVFNSLLKCVRLRSRACGLAQHGGDQSCPFPGSADEEEEPCAADICREIFLTHSLCGQL